MTSKLPTSDRPLIRDRDMAAAIERMLSPLTGQKLDKAQLAVRRVASSATQGPFATVLAAYRTAIDAATGGKET